MYHNFTPQSTSTGTKFISTEFTEVHIRSVSDKLSIYFDGKWDLSLIIKKCIEKDYRKTVLEEHICLIMEARSKYLRYLTTETEGSLTIDSGTTRLFEEESFSITSLVAIGCDGKRVNTGMMNGVIKRIESALGRPLHRFVCLIYSNELPLCHLFNFLDDTTSGHRSFTGPNGKELQKCENKAVASFTPVEVQSCNEVRPFGCLNYCKFKSTRQS